MPTKTKNNKPKTKREERKRQKEARNRSRKERMGRYRSIFERRIAEDLAARGIGFRYEPFPLYYFKRKRGFKCLSCGSEDVASETAYLPDFVLDNGIIIETKGRLTSEDRTKMIAVKKDNPDLDIRFLLLKDNWLTYSKKQRYSDWCTKNGFPWAIAKVPEDWAGEFL